MIGLDTNVLVRYIVQDDPDQSAAAERLIEGRCTAQAPGYVSVLVLAELVWVLTSAYDYKKVAVIPVIRQLLRVRLFFVGGRISLCGSEAGGNWVRHGVVREQRRGPVADGTCAVSDGWGCSAGTRALGGGSQYASMRRRPVAA